jgi:hypothetical protein
LRSAWRLWLGADLIQSVGQSPALAVRSGVSELHDHHFEKLSP